MKNKFTIIIPEHNRPDHLKRLLDESTLKSP